MKIDYKEIAFELGSTNKINFNGFLTYRSTPLSDIKGLFKPAESKATEDGRIMNFKDRIEIAIPPVKDGDKWTTIATLNIKSSNKNNKNNKFKEWGSAAEIKNLDRFFSVNFPVQGWMNAWQDAVNKDKFLWSIKASFNQDDMDYFTGTDYLANPDVKRFQYTLDDGTSWIGECTEEDLKDLGSIYPEYDAWYVKHFPAGGVSREIIAEQRNKVSEIEAKVKARRAAQAGKTVARAVPQ